MKSLQQVLFLFILFTFNFQFIRANTPHTNHVIFNSTISNFNLIASQNQLLKSDSTITEISITEIENYIDKDVKICTKVFGTKQITSGSKPTFLNCGAAFPNSPLTVVIFFEDLENFKENPATYYDGKNICITGRLIMYKGKPEIVVKKENDIEVK